MVRTVDSVNLSIPCPRIRAQINGIVCQISIQQLFTIFVSEYLKLPFKAFKKFEDFDTSLQMVLGRGELAKPRRKI